MMAGMNLPNTPVIILARPQMAENIGAAARAMMNCELFDLRLVKPRDGWPNPAAMPMAAGGSEIIENAIVFESLADATHDVSFMVATSARRRDLPIKSANPRIAASMLLAHAPERSISVVGAQNCRRTAMLFGPEASGLNNDEVVLADVLVTAPLNPAYPSLNLAQAVFLMAWEWRMAAHLIDMAEPVISVSRPNMSDGHYASIQERDFFFQRLESALDDGDFFNAPDMADTVKRNLRALLTRAMPSAREISTLHGVIQALTRQRK
jgi:tRNA/rRNA methyltransferase